MIDGRTVGFCVNFVVEYVRVWLWDPVPRTPEGRRAKSPLQLIMCIAMWREGALTCRRPVYADGSPGRCCRNEPVVEGERQMTRLPTEAVQ